MEIHGFCAASVEQSEKVILNLLLAKSRVAPVKTIWLPRFELRGAVFLVEVIEAIT